MSELFKDLNPVITRTIVDHEEPIYWEEFDVWLHYRTDKVTVDGEEMEQGHYVVRKLEKDTNKLLYELVNGAYVVSDTNNPKDHTKAIIRIAMDLVDKESEL